MYRRAKFLEILIEIRQEMARESDYDVDLFAEQTRQGVPSKNRRHFKMADTEQESTAAAAKKKNCPP